MPIWKLETSIWNDSVLPRDAFVITPHFNDQGVGTDPQGLCDDLADALDGWLQASHQIQVRAYDAQGAAPVYPQGTAIRNVGVSPNSFAPREIAVCLSFYSQRNIPRQRGRLFIAYPLIQELDSISVRPNEATRLRVGSLAPIFSDLGGPDVDWSVYSRTDDVARAVSNWWVDDEWDTIRSRGLRATTRTMGTADE